MWQCRQKFSRDWEFMIVLIEISSLYPRRNRWWMPSFRATLLPPPSSTAKKWLLMERTAQASGSSWRIGWKEDQFCRRHWKIGGGLIPPPKKQLNTNIYICVYIMCIYIYNVYIYIMYVYIYNVYIYMYIHIHVYIYIIRYKCCHHCQSPNVYPCLSKDGKWKWCSKAKHGPIWSSDCDASTCWPQIVLNLNWQARCMAQDRNTATWLVYFQTLTKISGSQRS